MKQDKRLFERLIRMLDLIPVSPRSVTANQLHKKLGLDGFDVSKRTVERDLIQLSENFGIFNDDTSLPHGWSWHKDSPRLSLPALTPEEALTFKLVESHLDGLMPVSLFNNMRSYISQADKVFQNPLLYKGYAKWLDKVQVVHPWQPLIAPEIDESIIAEVHEAILAELRLKVMYQARSDAEAQSRILNPLGLIIRGYITYLVCTIHPFEDIRLLAMHRIKSAERLQESIIKPATFNLKEYAISGALEFIENADAKISIRLKFNKGAGLHLIESPLSTDQKLLETESYLEVRATVADTMQLKWWILGFGAQVEVLEPLTLRDLINAELVNALKKYQ